MNCKNNITEGQVEDFWTKIAIITSFVAAVAFLCFGFFSGSGLMFVCSVLSLINGIKRWMDYENIE